jgi:hypothetical protein
MEDPQQWSYVHRIHRWIRYFRRQYRGCHDGGLLLRNKGQHRGSGSLH